MTKTIKQQAREDAPKVWVLLRAENDYNQYGEYFEAAFAEKPSVAVLAKHFEIAEGMPGNVMTALAFLSKLSEGVAATPTGEADDTRFELRQVVLL